MDDGRMEAREGAPPSGSGSGSGLAAQLLAVGRASIMSAGFHLGGQMASALDSDDEGGLGAWPGLGYDDYHCIDDYRSMCCKGGDDHGGSRLRWSSTDSAGGEGGDVSTSTGGMANHVTSRQVKSSGAPSQRAPTPASHGSGRESPSSVIMWSGARDQAPCATASSAGAGYRVQGTGSSADTCSSSACTGSKCDQEARCQHTAHVLLTQLDGVQSSLVERDRPRAAVGMTGAWGSSSWLIVAGLGATAVLLMSGRR